MKERGAIVTRNHTPTKPDTPIVRQYARPPANARQLRRQPHYEVDQFTAAMVEVATALRKAKRASKWERRLSA